MPRKNLYSILNVDPRASEAVIQAAYKVLANTCHPDHGGNSNVFNSLTEAKYLLLDPVKRKKYDREQKIAFGDKKIIGSYELVKFLAEGAMGRTYVVRHITTGNLACLKACLGIGPEYEEVFLNEAKAIWDIRHYAFPAVRDLLRLEDGALAIVMSYIPGPTLEQVVKHLGPIDPEHCGWIFERLLAGLNYLHASGVIHGDIKPQNIILQPERHGAVLIDFGLSMMKPTSKSANIGYTEHFSPPEQASTSVRKPLIPETDLYSLAMTILYALTGKLTDKHSIPSTVPREFKNFLLKFLETEVLKRPNWEKENILEGITKVRIACFGTKNTRGKIFPNVPCDVVV